MTQYEIAKRLKISEQAVSKWYNGKCLPSATNLFALAELFGKTPEELLRQFVKKRKAR